MVARKKDCEAPVFTVQLKNVKTQTNVNQNLSVGILMYFLKAPEFNLPMLWICNSENPWEAAVVAA